MSFAVTYIHARFRSRLVRGAARHSRARSCGGHPGSGVRRPRGIPGAPVFLRRRPLRSTDLGASVSASRPPPRASCCHWVSRTLRRGAGACWGAGRSQLPQEGRPPKETERVRPGAGSVRGREPVELRSPGGSRIFSSRCLTHVSPGEPLCGCASPRPHHLTLPQHHEEARGWHDDSPGRFPNARHRWAHSVPLQPQ